MNTVNFLLVKFERACIYWIKCECMFVLNELRLHRSRLPFVSSNTTRQLCVGCVRVTYMHSHFTYFCLRVAVHCVFVHICENVCEKYQKLNSKSNVKMHIKYAHETYLIQPTSGNGQKCALLRVIKCHVTQNNQNSLLHRPNHCVLIASTYHMHTNSFTKKPICGVCIVHHFKISHFIK